MKVLLVSPKMEKPNGGIVVWTEHYVSGCQAQGIECFILNTKAIGKRAIDGNAKRSVFDELIRTKKIFKNLRKFLKENNYNVAHINTSCGTFGIIRDYFIAKKIKKKLPNIKIITHFHCDIPSQINGSICKRYLKKLVKKSDKLLVLCENSKQYLKEEFGVEGIKIPNFISQEYIINKDKKIEETIKKLFFVGRVSVLKGAKEIYQLAQKFPNATFELAGGVSQEVMGWEKPNNVILLGAMKHEDVIGKLDKADAFIFPSHTEGFSVALMEAMARGLPIVATDVGANKDMVEENGGVIVPALDVDGLERAIKTIQNKQVREKMSSWCVNKVKEYTVVKVMELIKNIYEN